VIIFFSEAAFSRSLACKSEKDNERDGKARQFQVSQNGGRVKEKKNKSESTKISMNEKKYLINIDFPAVSRIHLNPNLYEIDQRCMTGPKNPEHGSAILTTEEEARQYLNHQRVLSFNSKPVTNLRICDLCSQNENFNL
jgi:hypothetical protein